MGVPQPFPTIVSVIVIEYTCTTWKSIKLNLLWLNLSSTFPRSSTQFTPHLRCVAAIAGERQRQTLTLTNKLDRDACYQLKTTCVARYAVLPNQALIAVGSSAEVEIVMMIEMDSLPPPDSLQDHFLIQAAFKEDPAEDVNAFWKRARPRSELFQDEFCSS